MVSDVKPRWLTVTRAPDLIDASVHFLIEELPEARLTITQAEYVAVGGPTHDYLYERLISWLHEIRNYLVKESDSQDILFRPKELGGFLRF